VWDNLSEYFQRISTNVIRFLILKRQKFNIIKEQNATDAFFRLFHGLDPKILRIPRPLTVNKFPVAMGPDSSPTEEKAKERTTNLFH
jgi:hypothetical protein